MEKKRVMHWVEEAILIFLILTDVLDFFDILPGDLDYIALVITWTALGYLLYKASLTRIFFNNRKKFVDILLITAYFMLVIKNLILFSSGRLEEYFIFYSSQSFLVEHSSLLEFYSFIIGSILILLLAFYSALFIDIKKPSLMHTIHEEGRPKSLYKLLVRIFAVYMVYIAFFIVVFNLVMEWIGISIDAPLLMVGLIFYIFIVAGHRRHDVESLIYKLGEFGVRFYEKFISLFHYKKTILLGISGMLVLHLFTDAISFIVPYIFVLRDVLYFGPLGPGHDALLPLYLEQIENQPFLEQFSLFFIYLLNTIGMLFLLLVPSLFWYLAFAKKSIKISKYKVSLVIVSISVMVTAPVFQMDMLRDNSIAGVDIKTHVVEKGFFDSFFQIFFFALVFIVLVNLLLNNYKSTMIRTMMMQSTVFFAYYTYLFLASLIVYYTEIVIALFSTSNFLLSANFLVFLAVEILFYLAGFIMFIDEMIKEKVYKKIS